MVLQRTVAGRLGFSDDVSSLVKCTTTFPSHFTLIQLDSSCNLRDSQRRSPEFTHLTRKPRKPENALTFDLYFYYHAIQAKNHCNTPSPSFQQGSTRTWTERQAAVYGGLAATLASNLYAGHLRGAGGRKLLGVVILL